MSRPRRNIIRQFRRSLVLWAEFSLFEGELERFNNLRPGWLSKPIHPDVRGRIQVSLKTGEPDVANKRAAELERLIGFVQANATAGTKKAQQITVADRFDQVAQKESADASLYDNPIQGRKQGFIRPRTARDRCYKRRLFLEFLAERFPTRTLSVHEVNVGVVAEFLDWLKHPSPSHRALSNVTRSSIKDYLSVLWNDAQHLEYCKENPWNHPSVQQSEYVEHDNGRVTMFHEAALFQSLPTIYRLPSTWDNNGIIIMALTGCRPSDLYQIQRGHVTAIDGLPFLNDLQSKTAKWKRLPLTRWLQPIIDRQFASHDALWLFPRRGDNDQWRPCREAEGTRRWYRQIKRLGLPGVTPYTFRYTFETAGQKLGFSALLINALMGHKSSRRTMAEIYTKFPTADIFQAAERIQASLLGATQPQPQTKEATT